jgi:hypothetical protein
MTCQLTAAAVLSSVPSPPRAASRPPWMTLIVRDANGQALGYFYYEDGPGRRAAAKLLTKAAAAHRMASFVKQPSSSGFEDCDSGTTQE